MTDGYTRDLWMKEYTEIRGIPSTFREDPSGSVKHLVQLLNENQFPLSGNALDIGSGHGRNSLFLAAVGFHVCAIDFVREALQRVAERGREAALVKQISPFLVLVGGPLPFRTGSFDIALDTFCYIYITGESQRACYRKELARALRAGGIYLLTGPMKTDGFYGPLLKNSEDDAAVVDPLSGIPSILLSEPEVKDCFSPDFEIVETFHRTGTRTMYGRAFEKDTLGFILRRTDMGGR